MAHRSSSLLLMVLVGAYVAAVSVAMPSMIPSDVSLGRAPKDARVMVHVTLKHDNDESKKKLVSEQQQAMRHAKGWGLRCDTQSCVVPPPTTHFRMTPSGPCRTLPHLKLANTLA